MMNQRDNRAISHNNNGNNTYNNNTSRQEHYRPTITCFNCNRTGHFSRDCPDGDNFPRGRRRGRGRGRGRSRGSSNCGNFRSTRGNRNHFHEIEEEFEDDSEFQDLSTLSLSSIRVNTQRGRGYGQRGRLDVRNDGIPHQDNYDDSEHETIMLSYVNVSDNDNDVSTPSDVSISSSDNNINYDGNDESWCDENDIVSCDDDNESRNHDDENDIVSCDYDNEGYDHDDRNYDENDVSSDEEEYETPPSSPVSLTESGANVFTYEQIPSTILLMSNDNNNNNGMTQVLSEPTGNTKIKSMVQKRMPKKRDDGVKGMIRIRNSKKYKRPAHVKNVDEFETLSLSTLSVSNVRKVRPTKRYVNFKFHKSGRSGRSIKDHKLKVDSGAEANVMPNTLYKGLYPKRVDDAGKPLEEYLVSKGATLTAYGGGEISHLGKVELPCQFKGRKFKAEFYITEVEGPILLGLPTGEALGIIVINVDNIETRKSDESIKYVHSDKKLEERPPINSKEDLKEMYPECFLDGPGSHFPSYEYHIHIEEGAQGKVHAPRRIPLEEQETVKAELDRMEKRGAITKVNTPTDWVNSMVVNKKPNGKLRICLDPLDLNKVIKREHYVADIVQDKVHLLNGSDTFTKLDLKDGYWHVKLDEESSFLTTFNTPYGRYRYLVMPFGLNVSQDIFQMKIDQTYEGCTNVLGIADDINVHSKGDIQHNLNLHAAMERTRQSNLTLNYDKIELKKSSIKFFGNIYTKDGVKPDPDKVKAINELRPPESKSELKTFLGMVNYLQQYIPKLSSHTAPLREIEKKGVEFYWDSNLLKVFNDIKEMVATDVTLAYYDRSKPVTVQTDYSKLGLGAVLLQDGRPVHYGSKALVGSEVDFAPIEGEMLAIVYATKKWHHYLYGRRFTVETDHKPLVDIKNKNVALAPPRIKGMLMATCQYDYELRHKPGREMVLPDTLSRLSRADKDEIPGLKLGVHNIVEVTDERLQRLVNDTANDDVSKRLIKVFKQGWPTTIKQLDRDLHPYWSIRDDISVIDGLIMCGSRIIIPEASRKETLENIHEGHQGEKKCVLRAKSSVYWPGMYKEIEEVVQRCSTCREFSNAQPKCPMISMKVPPCAWHTLGADHFFYKGKIFLLVSDYLSKMPFVRPLSSTSAFATIKAMKNIIAENGVPHTVISDNETFNSKEFKCFASKYGFRITTSSPEYPRGHGLIERHVQTIKKCMYKCDHSGQDFELALLSLRATPLDNNLASPAELLNGRKYKTTVPSLNVKPIPETQKEIEKHLQDRQERSRKVYDRHTKSKQTLLPKQPVRVYNKTSRRWEPAVVKGFADTPRSYIIQRNDGGIPLRRNRQHLKITREKWPGDVPPMNPEELYDSVPDDIMRLEPVPEQSVVSDLPSTSENTSPENTVQPVIKGSRYPGRVRREPDWYVPLDPRCSQTPDVRRPRCSQTPDVEEVL